MLQLNHNTLTQLTKELQEQLWQNFIKQHNSETIEGEALLNFAPHQQINLFLLFQVYYDWNQMIRKLSNTYFNFEHPEVQEALQQFKSALSKHIRIPSQVFLPMLERAIFNNLQLINTPVESLTNFFFGKNTTIKTGIFSRYAPYFSDFGFVVQSMVAYVEKKQMSTITKDVFIEKAQKILSLYEQKTGEPIKDYREKLFKSLTGKSLEDYASEEVETPIQDATITSQRILENLIGENIALKQQQKEAQKRNPLLSAIDYTPVPRLADKFQQGPTLHEKLISVESIPLHKQMEYIKHLFKGDNVLFQQALDHINTLNSYKEALQYLREEVFSKTQPDPNNPVVDEFLNFLEKRFQSA